MKFVNKKKERLFIIQEYIHEEDKNLRSLSKYVMTDTEDRVTLYIILEEN